MRTMLLSLLLLFSFSLFAETVRFLPLPASAEVVKTQVRNGILNINFYIDALDIDKTEQLKSYKEVKIKGLENSDKVGAPALPFYSQLVIGHPDELDITVYKDRAFSLHNLNVIPAPQMPTRCASCVGQKAKYQVNTKLYDGELRAHYRVDYLGDFAGHPLSRITIVPVDYNHEKSVLTVYPLYEVAIKNLEGNTVRAINHAKEILSLRGARGIDKLLIVSPAKYKNALEGFMDWKEQQGIAVELVLMDEISDNADANTIKSYLHNRYANPETTFTHAILVGSESVFPTFYRRTSSSSKTPTDLPYFAMGGANDYIPEVLYGRMVVTTEEDILNQTKKIIAYEKAEYTDDSGLGKGFTIASDEGSNPSDEDYANSIAKEFKKHADSSFWQLKQGSRTATTANIQKAFGMGAMWITYIGHGSGTAWASTNNYYSNSDISGMPQAEVKPVIIDVACQNGRFKRGYFGERFMNVTEGGNPKGAVAYYGGSVNISWHPPAIMSVGIAKEFFAKNLEKLGEALLAGQIYLSTHYSEVSSVKDNFVWYHLFGDPTLKLRVKP